MLHDLLPILAGTAGLIGAMLVGVGFTAAHSAMYAFKSKEDDRSLAEKYCATRRLAERQKISAEAWSHFGEAWKSTPARWLIFIGAGMFVGAVVCGQCFR